MIEVYINGEKERVREGSTISKVLTQKKVKPEMVAVEINGKLIDREDYAGLNLKEGDKIEYLFYMAGGSQ